MTDPLPTDPPAEPAGSPTPQAPGRCPWCSAELPADDPAACPACGAALRELVEGELPGVTLVDPDATLAAAKARRTSLRAMLGLKDSSTAVGSGPSTVERPSDDVRREMLRLELDALEAELESRAAAIAAARAEAGLPPITAVPPPPDEDPPG